MQGGARVDRIYLEGPSDGGSGSAFSRCYLTYFYYTNKTEWSSVWRSGRFGLPEHYSCLDVEDSDENPTGRPLTGTVPTSTVAIVNYLTHSHHLIRSGIALFLSPGPKRTAAHTRPDPRPGPNFSHPRHTTGEERANFRGLGDTCLVEMRRGRVWTRERRLNVCLYVCACVAEIRATPTFSATDTAAPDRFSTSVNEHSDWVHT